MGLTEKQFICLRAAVNTARQENIKDLKTLKQRLHGRFPEEDIKAALQFWAKNIRIS